MFRRKDENPAETSAQPAMSPAIGTPGNASAPSGSETAQAASVPASSNNSAPSAPAASPYAPAAAPRLSASEPARPVAAAAPSYRPSPVAEFNRNISRSPSENLRAAAAPQSSFGSGNEKNASKPNRRVLTVGNDILLKGEIATCDRLVIEGRVEAKLSDVHTVEIAECGSFKGTAEVEDAEISGVFEGDLVVRNRLVIYATGEVRGNISYGEIEIERGGRLTGQIKTVAQSGTKAKPVQQSLETPEPKARAVQKEASVVAA